MSKVLRFTNKEELEVINVIPNGQSLIIKTEYGTVEELIGKFASKSNNYQIELYEEGARSSVIVGYSELSTVSVEDMTNPTLKTIELSRPVDSTAGKIIELENKLLQANQTASELQQSNIDQQSVIAQLQSDLMYLSTMTEVEL